MAALTRRSFELVGQLGARVTRGLRPSSICWGTLSAKDLLPRRVRWDLMTKGARFETVCHNELFSWNTVFRSGVPVAFIDWDTAAPGPRAWDQGNGEDPVLSSFNL